MQFCGAKMRAERGERVFLRGAYKDVRDLKKTEFDKVMRSIYAPQLKLLCEAVAEYFIGVRDNCERSGVFL